MLASFGFFGLRDWIQPLALTAGCHSSVTIRNFKKLQYKRFKAIKKSEISCSIQKINFLYDLSQKLDFWQLRAKSMAYFIWPWCLPGDYSAQAIKEYIDYELKYADNPYVLCKLLSLTYYNLTALRQITSTMLFLMLFAFKFEKTFWGIKAINLNDALFNVSFFY